MSPKPCRPYTEYNLFFQLERERILQIELGFQPDYEPSEIFDPADASYQGPSLPSRYQDLILLNDWHMPGKEKRRKRRHRKTHGRIGFQELSLKIATAWKNIDPETRNFCSDLCDVGLTQYKVAMLAFKAAQDEDTDSITVKTLEQEDMKIGAKPMLLDIAPPAKAKFVPTERCSMADIDAAFENDLALSLENLHGSMSDITASDSSMRGSLADSMVDIEDDEIIDMWKSTPAETVDNEATVTAPATAVSNFSGSSNVCQFISQQPQGQITTSTSSFDPYGKNSYIDNTMNDLKNMRKALLNQQIQMQTSIIAARRLTKGLQKQKPGNIQGMHGLAARSA